VTNQRTAFPASICHLGNKPAAAGAEYVSYLDGANQCLARLGALIGVNVEPPAPGVQQQVAARGGVAAVVPPPDEAGVPKVQDREPTSVDALLDTGVQANEEAAAVFTPSSDLELDPPQTVERPSAPPYAIRRSPASRRSKSSRSNTPPKPLHSVFDELREPAGPSIGEATAHEHYDRAKYHLQDGNEAAAMVELTSPGGFAAVSTQRRSDRDVSTRMAALVVAPFTDEASCDA
jgi:hypothetical protein